MQFLSSQISVGAAETFYSLLPLIALAVAIAFAFVLVRFIYQIFFALLKLSVLGVMLFLLVAFIDEEEAKSERSGLLYEAGRVVIHTTKDLKDDIAEVGTILAVASRDEGPLE